MLSTRELSAMQENAQQAAAVLRALSNETRLLVMCQLGQGEMSVGALQEAVGLGQSALSQHLARLRAEGFVTTRREGQTIHYRIADPRVSRLIGALHDIFCNPKKGRLS
ncbi:MAG: ArsR/SmtB family transcription factor [Alphaproteobacteria bacterium]|jgi:DNA-binding transcriptional ArsR family regulator